MGVFLQQNNWSCLRKANLDLEEEFLLLEGVISDVGHQVLCWLIIHLLEACHVLGLGQDLQKTTTLTHL